jgi:hypothetical protein
MHVCVCICIYDYIRTYMCVNCACACVCVCKYLLSKRTCTAGKTTGRACAGACARAPCASARGRPVGGFNQGKKGVNCRKWWINGI